MKSLKAALSILPVDGEKMHSYCYFRYYQNITFQQGLPQAFAKSLKKEKTVEESACTQFQEMLPLKKSKLLLTNYKKH